MDDLSDEEKRAIAMKCNFNCLLIMTTSAVCCGLAATSWCAFAQRDITLVSGASIEAVCEENKSYFSSDVQCESFLDNHAIGFWAWQATVPVNQLVCMSYTQAIAGRGYVTLETDTKFNTAAVSAGIASFFGLLCFFTLIMSSCCPLSPARMAGMSCYYFIATLFQGLSFLIFASNACDKGFFEPWASSSNITDTIESVSCSLGKGGKLAVSACVLYFFCMCSVPVAQPPTPIGGNPFAKPDEAREAGDAAAGAAAAAAAAAVPGAAPAGGEDP